jgi:hypothetical protein
MQSSLKYVNDLWSCYSSININYIIITHCSPNGKLPVFILLGEILKCK